MAAVLWCACAVGCLVLMGLIVLFDAVVRLIPRVLCWLLALCGLGMQLGMQGGSGVVAGLAWAAGMLAVCAVSTRVLTVCSADGRAFLGGGDIRCMVALSLASGSTAPYGVFACFASATVWALSQRTRGCLLAHERFAFAPFLAIWLVVCVVLMMSALI